METNIKGLEKELKEWTEYQVDEVGADIITGRGPTGEGCQTFFIGIKIDGFDREKIIDAWKDSIKTYRKAAGCSASEPYVSLPPERDRIFTLYWRRYPTFTFIETDKNKTLALVGRLLITCQKPPTEVAKALTHTEERKRK